MTVTEAPGPSPVVTAGPGARTRPPFQWTVTVLGWDRVCLGPPPPRRAEHRDRGGPAGRPRRGPEAMDPGRHEASRLRVQARAARAARGPGVTRADPHSSGPRQSSRP